MPAWMKKLFVPYSAETKKVQGWFFFGSWAILAAIGLFISQTVLTDHPNLRAFTDFMASFIPQIDRVTALNLKPEINRLHYSLLWAVSPVYFVVFANWIFREVATETVRRTYGQAVFALLGSIVLAGFAMFLWGFGDPSNRIERIMFYYPLSRAVTAPLLVIGFCISVLGVLVTIWRLFTHRFHRATDGATNEGKTHG